MIYTSIISLLIEKPSYLLRSESFSFQRVSELIDIFVKLSNFMSPGGEGVVLDEINTCINTCLDDLKGGNLENGGN